MLENFEIEWAIYSLRYPDLSYDELWHVWLYDEPVEKSVLI